MNFLFSISSCSMYSCAEGWRALILASKESNGPNELICSLLNYSRAQSKSSYLKCSRFDHCSSITIIVFSHLLLTSCCRRCRSLARSYSFFVGSSIVYIRLWQKETRKRKREREEKISLSLCLLWFSSSLTFVVSRKSTLSLSKVNVSVKKTTFSRNSPSDFSEASTRSILIETRTGRVLFCLFIALLLQGKTIIWREEKPFGGSTQTISYWVAVIVISRSSLSPAERIFRKCVYQITTTNPSQCSQ